MTKFYPVIRICKEDLEEAFKGEKEALEKIKSLTPTQMKYFTEKLANALVENGFWQVLEDTFRCMYLEF